MNAFVYVERDDVAARLREFCDSARVRSSAETFRGAWAIVVPAFESRDHWRATSLALDGRLTEALDCLEDCVSELQGMRAEGLPGVSQDVIDAAARLLRER